MTTPSLVRATFKGSGGNELAARIDLPVGPIRAFALFAHCFTCTKDVLAAKRIAESLAAAGVGVLRFDFTGLGSSEGEFANTNFSSNVADLVHAAGYLSEAYLAPAILIGHSLGGAAVLVAAADIPEAKAVVTIGAPADVVHVNVLYGDAFTLQDNARGGSDHLTGGDNSLNVLIGDAGGIAGNGRGGNDHLIGGDGSSDNTLIGDAYFMSDNARGGNDTLVSGTGTDHMWGDAQSINGVAASPTAPTGAVVTGADTFVFAPANGNDDINDFRQSDHDKIDVRAYGFHDIADMNAA